MAILVYSNSNFRLFSGKANAKFFKKIKKKIFVGGGGGGILDLFCPNFINNEFSWINGQFFVNFFPPNDSPLKTMKNVFFISSKKLFFFLRKLSLKTFVVFSLPDFVEEQMEVE